GINDIMKILRPNWEATITKVRVFSMLLGFCALWLALRTNDILKLMLTAGSLYMPVISVPMLFAIFGFRSTPKAALTGMAAGIITVASWDVVIGDIGMDKVVPAMLANAIFLLGSHYFLRQP